MKLFYRKIGDKYYAKQNYRRALTFYKRYNMIDPDSREIKTRIASCREKLSEGVGRPQIAKSSAAKKTTDKKTTDIKTTDKRRDQVKRLLEESVTESAWIIQYLFEDQSGEKDSETPW